MRRKKTDINGIEPKAKKPIYKRPWFIVVAVLIVIGIAGSMGGGDDAVADQTPTPVAEKSNDPVSVEETTEPVVEEPEPVEEPEEEPDDGVSQEFKNALSKADSYANMMHMSKQGVFDQLTSEYGEGFPEDAATYAVENVQTDWNENAYQKGKTYYTDMAMSLDGVYDQLISEYGEQFTEEQASYAVEKLRNE